MSEDHYRAEPQIETKGQQLMERFRELIKEAIEQQEESTPTFHEIESIQITNEKIIGKNFAVENKAQPLSSFKYTDEDIRIKDYFGQQKAMLPIAYFDIDTSYDISFRLSDLAIIGYDKKDDSLKMINTLQQEINYEKKKNIMSKVMMEKSFLEIRQEIMQLEQKQGKFKGFQEIEVRNEDQVMEEVTKVILNQDKTKIILGTSYGKLTVIDVKTFKSLIILNNPIKTSVTDVVEKKGVIVVGYQNGQIIVFQRPMAFNAYSSKELRKADNDPIRSLKLSYPGHHLIAVKECHKDNQDIIVDQFVQNFISHEEIFNIKSFDLILYDLKELKEIGQTELFSSKSQSQEFNKLFDFSKECFIMLSPDQCSFRVYSLKNCKLISQGPDNIDPSTIQFIKCLNESKYILVVSFNGDSYFFELQGKEILDPKNINFASYMITPCGADEMQLVNLPERVTLFKFPKKLHNQLVLFKQDERWLYFTNEKETFLIQLQQIKPKFQQIINAKMTRDQQILFYTYKFSNMQLMDIMHFKSGIIFKTYKSHEPITTSYDSKFFFCEDRQNKKIIKINLKTLESEFIKESNGQMLIASRFGNLIYCSQQDFKTQKFKLICMELGKKTQTSELALQFDEDFNFYVANNENHLIISTKDGRLIKVNIIDPKFLEFIEEIDHPLGHCSYINFEQNDNHFICGGHLSSDLYIYNFRTMSQVTVIDNHNESCCQGYFVSKQRLVTKNDTKLIYWNWNGDLELLFQVDQPNQLVKGFNNIITALVLDNEINLWSEELTHELAQSIVQIQPSDLQKEWSIGPIILVHQLIINHFYSVNEQEKIKLLPHVLKYTVLPYGYTFLCKLVYLNQKQLIKEALKFTELTYKRDIYGNTPLIYALKSKDFETIDNILQFLTENKKYISTIRFQALTLLFQSAPSQLVHFLEKSVMKIEGFQMTGQKINENQKTYFEQDSQTRFHNERVYNYLCNVKCQEFEKLPIVFSKSMINVNCELGSTESIQLSQAIEACPDQKIFKTQFIINLLNHKWQKIKPFANFLLILQVCFTATVSIHSFSPGEKFYINILQLQNYFWAAIEIIIFVQSDYQLTYNSKINIWLFIVLNIYCFNTLQGASPLIDNMLPMINWLAWFQMTLQLQQFDLIRTFCCVFLNTVSALDGFCYFLLLMIFTFSTTQDIIQKNTTRIEKYGDDRGPYNEFFYLDHNITQNFDENVHALMDTFFNTWVAIVKGDFNDDQTLVSRLFILLSTFISNVVLLNLIIAFMSDSYADVMGQIFEKKNKTLNQMTVRLEKVLYWKKNLGKKTHLIWVDYENETGLQEARDKTLPEQIEDTQQKCLDEFEKNQRVQFNDLQSQVVQTRQKLYNQINKQESVLSNLQDQNIKKLKIFISGEIRENMRNQGQSKDQNFQIERSNETQKNQMIQITDNLYGHLKTQQQQLENINNIFANNNVQLMEQITSQLNQNKQNYLDNNNILAQQNSQLSNQINNIQSNLSGLITNQQGQIQTYINNQFSQINQQISLDVKNSIQNQDSQMNRIIEQQVKLSTQIVENINNSQIKSEQNETPVFSQQIKEMQNAIIQATSEQIKAQEIVFQVLIDNKLDEIHVKISSEVSTQIEASEVRLQGIIEKKLNEMSQSQNGMPIKKQNSQNSNSIGIGEIQIQSQNVEKKQIDQSPGAVSIEEVCDLYYFDRFSGKSRQTKQQDDPMSPTKGLKISPLSFSQSQLQICKQLDISQIDRKINENSKLTNQEEEKVLTQSSSVPRIFWPKTPKIYDKQENTKQIAVELNKPNELKVQNLQRLNLEVNLDIEQEMNQEELNDDAIENSTSKNQKRKKNKKK